LVTTKDVPPGGAGEIKATFKSKGYSGSVKKSVTVATNDPENPTVRLTLKGKVVAEVTVDPRYVNFGNVQKDKLPDPKKLEIELREGKGLRIEGVRSENPSILVKVKKADEACAEYLVSLAGDVPTGRVAGQIIVRTNSKKNPDVKVSVHAYVQGNVTVSPQVVSLGIVAPGKVVTREITLKKAGEKNFTIKEVKATTDDLTSEVVTEREGERYKIEVSYDPGKRTKGRISEKLTVITKNGEQETILLPVYGAIRAKPPARK